jgi:hypothetical protein
MGWDAHPPFLGWWELQDPHIPLEGHEHTSTTAGQDLLV